MVQVEDANLLRNPEEEYIHKTDSSTLLSKYNIPVDHLDFPYIEKCTDGRELERILAILRSGEEGYYPQLMEQAEERLKIIKPKSKLLRDLDRVVSKEDVDKKEWCEISQDLNEFVSSISKDNQELETRKSILTCDRFPEVRQPQTISEATKKPIEKRIASTDYKSWDKYDPDTELLKIELGEEKIRREALEGNKKEKPKKNVKFNACSTEAEATFFANTEREKGNEFFKTGDYIYALEHYNASITCKTTVPSLNNRAMTYIKLKKYDKALNDCNQVLNMEVTNVKAWLRKAMALECLNLPERSLEAAEKCIQLEPNNTNAQAIAQRMRSKSNLVLKKQRMTIEEFEDSDVEEIKNDFEKVEINPRRNGSPISQQKEITIPIPGPCKMVGPHFVKCPNEPDIIQDTICQINSRSRILGFVTNDSDEEEDCSVNHLKTRCTIERDEVVVKKNKKNLDTPICEVPICKTNIVEQKKNQLNRENTFIKKGLASLVKDEDAGGEPYTKLDKQTLTQNDVNTPYSFLKSWFSIGYDPTYCKYAEVLRNINLGDLVRVIGYKMDNDMFSIMIRCLSMHFTVPSEVDLVYHILMNVSELPRFNIIALMMSQEDRNYVNILISFLQQHDRPLPGEIAFRFLQ